MIYLVTIVVLTLSISALCSLSEAALYSSRLPYLESIKEKYPKNRSVSLFIKMKNNVEIPITSILILNTIANTAGATLAGMFAAKELPAPWIPLFSIALTLGILIFAEILPKTYGAVAWKTIWGKISWPLHFVSILLWPLIKLSQFMLRLVTKGKKTGSVSEEEIIALVKLGARTGEISQMENSIIQNILKLEDIQLEDIMTPRQMIFSLDESMLLTEARELVEAKGFSRIPVYQQDKEKVNGYIRVNDLLATRNIARENLRLKDISMSIDKKPATMNCLTLLMEFLKNRHHIALVLDEYFQVHGIVTLEDLLETMLGHEIVDETDQFVDLQKEARKRLKKSSTHSSKT
ncbi:MAG: DUF21 domain-containing protein [Spirochaetales bacterium]|nr:DUF21 domain-containing protein [Spirochaetales bacterium]